MHGWACLVGPSAELSTAPAHSWPEHPLPCTAYKRMHLQRAPSAPQFLGQVAYKL